MASIKFDDKKIKLEPLGGIGAIGNNELIENIDTYAKSQGIIQTVTNTFAKRLTADGLDIVNGMPTTVQRISYPNGATSLVKVSGIKSTTKNLLTSLEVTSVKSNGAEIDYVINEDGSVTLTGNNIRGSSEYYLAFTQWLEKGTYTLSGCPPLEGARDRYIYVAKSGKNLGTDYGFTPNGVKFTIDEAGYCFIRCNISKGASDVNVTFYPMIVHEGIDSTAFVPYMESILTLPQEYALMDGGYIDVENLDSNSYIAWKDGNETIIGDGEVEVTQSYCMNLQHEFRDNFVANDTFRCEEIIATSKIQYDYEKQSFGTAFGARLNYSSVSVNDVDHETSLTAEGLRTRNNTSDEDPMGFAFRKYLGINHPDADSYGYEKLMHFFYGGNKLIIPNANGTLGLAKEIENKFYGYTSGPIYLKENSITFIMTLKNDTHNGLGIYAGDVDSETSFTHACIVVPKNREVLEDGSISNKRRAVCFRLIWTDDVDAEGNLLGTYHYEPKFANVIYTNEGELNIRKAEGNSCATWTISLD